jgi:hypothetical protein
LNRAGTVGGRRDYAEPRVTRRGVGGRERRVIQNVEDFEAQLQIRLLFDREV